jgi:hypothetical protein
MPVLVKTESPTEFIGWAFCFSVHQYLELALCEEGVHEREDVAFVLGGKFFHELQPLQGIVVDVLVLGVPLPLLEFFSNKRDASEALPGKTVWAFFISMFLTSG